MRISSATWPLFRDAHGRWPWDPWRWFHGCGCSSCVAPTRTMQETMFLPLDHRRASNLARSNRVQNGLAPAAKLGDGALSLGFPSFRSAAPNTHDKNFDNPIHAFFCVSRFTDRVGRHARGIAHWLRSFRNNDNRRRIDAATLRRDLLCGSPDCLASAKGMPRMSSPLRRPYSGRKRLAAPPLPRPSAVLTIRTAKGSIPITAAPFSAKPGIASIVDSARRASATRRTPAGNDPIDVSLTVLAPPRSLIPRWARTPGLRSKDGILRQSRGGSEFRCA
jgi:hypothetical protein